MWSGSSERRAPISLTAAAAGQNSSSPTALGRDWHRRRERVSFLGDSRSVIDAVKAGRSSSSRRSLGVSVSSSHETPAGRFSIRELARWADEVGLRSANGKRLDRDAVRKLLCNVSFTGKVAYRRRAGGEDIVQGLQEPIIDDQLFARVQEMMRARRYSPPSRPFGRDPCPLPGIARCGFDGTPMVGVKAGSGEPYMVCSTSHRHGRDACEQPMVKAKCSSLKSPGI